mgnify:CR=1 FL=1
MKKIISIVLGVAALAACTKTSVSYEQPGEIALAPVTRANMTKAAITGTTFPTTNDMGVYAFYNAGKLAGTLKDVFLDGSAAYLNNVEFVNRTGSGNWGGSTSYYWPKTGSLVFAAYSPKAADLAYDAAKDEFSTKTETDYVQSADLAKTVDLLWSPMTDKSHDKTTISVPMVFNHAMSWVTVQAVAANTESEGKFKVKSVKLNGIVNKGTFKTAGATIDWTPSTATVDVKTLSVFSNEAYTEIPKMTPAVVLENVEKGTVVIPQSLGDAVTLTVVFSQVMPTGAWSADQNLTFTLNKCKVGEPAVELNKWDNGKHYIYTLNFNIKGAAGENEILIKPTLTDWENVTANGINAQ